MDQVLLCSSQIPLTTSISNSFIKKYMLNANGSYVKVYLYLSMCIQSGITNLSISSLADMMENTEKDILRALQYWEKKNLLVLQKNDNDDSINGILLLNTDDATQSNTTLDTASYEANEDTAISEMTTAAYSNTSTPDDKSLEEEPQKESQTARREISVSREQTERVAQNDDFSWACLIVESYLNRPITAKEADLLTYLFDTLHFSKDLILYLYEYCCSIEKTNINYVQAVAFSWADHEITTPEEAQTFSHQYNECHSAICKTLGLNRSLASIELQYIDRWQNEWGMDLAVILDACNRTMLAIQKPDFKYLNGILDNWHQNNVHTLQDVQLCDETYNKKKNNVVKRNTNTAKTNNTKNQFQAFEQRNTSSAEMEQLEKLLLKR